MFALQGYESHIQAVSVVILRIEKLDAGSLFFML